MSRNCTCEAMVATVGQTQRKLSILKKGTSVYITRIHFSLWKWPMVTFQERSGREMVSIEPGSAGGEGYYCWNSTLRWDLNRRQSHQTPRFHHCTTLSHTFSNEIFGGRPSIKWLFSKRRTHWGKGVGRCAILFWPRKVLRFSIQNLIFWDGSINVISLER